MVWHAVYELSQKNPTFCLIVGVENLDIGVLVDETTTRTTLRLLTILNNLLSFCSLVRSKDVKHLHFCRQSILSYVGREMARLCRDISLNTDVSQHHHCSSISLKVFQSRLGKFDENSSKNKTSNKCMPSISGIKMPQRRENAHTRPDRVFSISRVTESRLHRPVLQMLVPP